LAPDKYYNFWEVLTEIIKEFLMFSSFQSHRNRKKFRFLPRLEELETRALPSTYVSTNWSGYGVETDFNSPASYAVTSVSGTWKVPTVASSNSFGWSSTWVGIDGFSSSTVEQLGTEQDTALTAAYYGMPQYYAWYEMYPAYPVTIPLTIRPGDSITASVTYSGPSSNSSGTFTLSLADNSTPSQQPFSITQSLTSAKRSSAEWIEEAPSSGGVLPLANFQNVSFTNSTATVNGTTGPISAFPNASINMITKFGQTLDTTSSLNSTGDGFTVNFAGSSSGGGTHHRHGRFTTMDDATEFLTPANAVPPASVNQAAVFPPLRPSEPISFPSALAPSRQTNAFPGFLIVSSSSNAAETGGEKPGESKQDDGPSSGTIHNHSGPKSDNGKATDGPAGPLSVRAVDDFFADTVAKDQNQVEEIPTLAATTTPVIDVVTGAEMSFLILVAYLGNPIKAKETEDNTKRKVKWL
jgi:hypothetical protein